MKNIFNSGNTQVVAINQKGQISCTVSSSEKPESFDTFQLLKPDVTSVIEELSKHQFIQSGDLVSIKNDMIIAGFAK